MSSSDLFLFVSHVSEDRAAALDIVGELERRGVPCWIAPRNVRPGRSFDDEIADAIEASRAMLLVFSDLCNESEYIRREVTVAGESHKVIIPFRIEDAQPRRGLRVRLSDLHWIDGFVSRERAIEELAESFTPSVSEKEQHERQQAEARHRDEEKRRRQEEEQNRRQQEGEQRRLREKEQRRQRIATAEMAPPRTLLTNGVILSVAFSPDGRILASGASFPNAGIILWDVANGEVRRTLLTSDIFDKEAGFVGRLLRTPLKVADHHNVQFVAFSRDGRTLASGSNHDAITLWDVASGKARRTLAGHTDSVTSVAFSPDERILASGSCDLTIKLWDFARGRLVNTLTDHTSSAQSVAFSPDGRTLASGSTNGTITLWDAASGQAWCTLHGNCERIRSIAFSPDGRILASGSGDKTIKLWDVASGELLHALTGHKGSVLSVTFSPDGRMLASGSGDNTINLWDVASSQMLRTLTGYANEVCSVAFSPDGRILASGSYGVKLWDLSKVNKPSE
jgi:hypothetical protein